MIKLTIKKTSGLAVVLCNAALLAILGYEICALSQIYQKVNDQGRVDVIKHVARVNFDALNKAADKYKYGQSFAIEASGLLKGPVSDPFGNPVKDPEQK